MASETSAFQGFLLKHVMKGTKIQGKLWENAHFLLADVPVHENAVRARQGSPPPIFNLKTFNVGGLGQLMAINLVWLFRPMEIIHESYEAEVSVSVAESEFDPISKLVAGDAIRGRMAVIDIPGAPYLFPVGLAGIPWSNRTFFMRYR